jgi:flavin-dependent dehydrogenase
MPEFPGDSRYDVVVVGARAAGAATAMLLARAGMKVLAIDRQSYGSDTLSTHALMRPAVMQLARWGLFDRLAASGAPVITSTSFHYGGQEVPIAIRPEPGIPGLIAPRRTVLDRTIADAAREAGAHVLYDVTMVDLVFDAGGVARGIALRRANGSGSSVAAEMIVGADGLGSAVARKAGARIIARGRASVAHVYGYTPMPERYGYHWYFGQNLAGGVIPTNDGLSCVVVSVPTARYDAEFRFDLAERRRSALAELDPRLEAHAASCVPLRAFRGTPGQLREAFGRGWLLVGDAGFFRDPLTSHGISDAFRDAEGAAAAILAGTEPAMQRFQDERDAYALPILEATDAISGFDWSLEELPARHRKFSDAMKAEAALLAARSACDRVAPMAAPARRPAAFA